MSALSVSLGRAIQPVMPLWQHVVDIAVPCWRWAVHWWHAVRTRHGQLMDSDSAYPIALAAGSAAAVRVLIGNPAVAKAIGILAADLLGVPEPGTRTARRDEGQWRPRPFGDPRWDDDWDDRD